LLRRGLSLVEVSVATCLIAVLAAVSLPMLSQANSQARTSACRANLTQLGEVLVTYEADRGTLPVLFNRDDRALSVPTLDGLAEPYAIDPSVLHCPSDDSGLYQRSGTSYQWFSAWDGRSLQDSQPLPDQPLLADKAPLHDDQEPGLNGLFWLPPENRANAPRLVADHYTP
jgi:type II secretory pathway pseudopilin PulG